MGNFVNYLAFSFFVVGAIGGLYALVRDLVGRPRRVEVHHRYHAVPVYYGSERASRGDMAQHQTDPDAAA